MAGEWGPPNSVCYACKDEGRIPNLIPHPVQPNPEEPTRYIRKGWLQCNDTIHDNVNNKIYKERGHA
jgi:hypothetical protein